MKEIIKYLKDMGYDSLSPSWYNNIELWNSWYRGRVSSFHNYTQYNGLKYIKRVRKSMQMGKRVCEDRADLLLNEKARIKIGEKEAQEIFDKIILANRFDVNGNRLVEIANATGTGAFVEYVGKGRVKIDYIPANMIFPLSWDNGAITECAFASRKSIKGGKFIYLNMHVLNEFDKYVVKNVIFTESTSGEIKLSNLPPDILPEFETNSEVPLFQIITPNMVNNIDGGITNNPMGISRFGNAIDTLQLIDLIFDSLNNEFRLGKKRIAVSERGIKVDIENGQARPVFDDNDVEFYAMDMSEDVIKEINMALRVGDHDKALNIALNVFSIQCGMGANYYSWDKDGGLKTATEVISDNSTLWRNKNKDDIILVDALKSLASGVIYLNNEFTDNANIVSDGVSIDLDDSIIDDKAATIQNALMELNSGIIDQVEYLIITRKWTEQQATEYIKKRDERSPKPIALDFFGGDKA